MQDLAIPNDREVKQQEDGSFMCIQCHGDWYGCDCPRLPERINNDNN